jgi:hypothetical protein
VAHGLKTLRVGVSVVDMNSPRTVRAYQRISNGTTADISPISCARFSRSVNR